MRARRHEHELSVEVVLPEERLCLVLLGGEAHVARQSFAIDLHVSSVGTLQQHHAVALVYDSEVRQLALVARMGVVEQTVPQGDGRTVIRQVDDAEGLAVGDVLRAIGSGFLYGEVVKLGIAAVLSVLVKGEERMPRPLEGDELIGQRHLAAQPMEMLAVGAVGILGLVFVVFATRAQPYFLLGQTNGLVDGVVGGLFKPAQGQVLAVLHDASPGAGHVDVAQSGHVAVLHALYRKLYGGYRRGADDALGQRVACPHQLVGRHRVQPQLTAFEGPHLLLGVVVPLPHAP